MSNDFREGFTQNSEGYYSYTLGTEMNQNYGEYKDEDFKVWKILYDRQIENLPGKVTQDYLDGIKIVQFESDKIPNFEEVNKILQPMTGWRVHVVPGLIPNKEFFTLMMNRNFCATTWLRTMEQLDYLEEPDMFHDVFGHVPLLSNQKVCDFLADLSRIALAHIESAAALEAIARLYWFTVEFGLIQEKEGLRIYGAGIVSSSGETQYSLFDEKPERLPYDVKTIINTPYIKDRYQERYFVLESFDQLYNSVTEIEALIAQTAEQDLIVS